MEDPFRDDPDAVSLHTTAGDSYTDVVAEDATVGSDTARPTAHAGARNANHGGAEWYYTGVSPPETHISSTAWRIGNKRTRIANEVISLQDQRSDADPGYLESWVSYMATLPPSPYIHITGTHSETKRDKDGKSKREQVLDFRILVSLQNYLWPNFNPNGPNERSLTTADSGEKTYRGTVFKQRAPGVKGDIEVGHEKPTLKEWCHRYCAKATGTKV